MNTNIQGDLEICISVPLKAFIKAIKPLAGFVFVCCLKDFRNKGFQTNIKPASGSKFLI